MTTLQEILAADLADEILADVAGGASQAVTYTPAGGAGVSIRAIAGPIEDGRVEVSDSEFREQTREIAVVPMDIGIASPAVGDTVTIGSDRWAVERIIEKSGAIARLDTRLLRRRRLAGDRTRLETP